MGIVKLPKMNEYEIKTAIEKENICRIAFIDKDFPYIAPFQYVFLNNTLYFHITDYGKKKKILAKNDRICLSIENFKQDLSDYYFISIRGKLEKVTDENEKQEIILKMVNEASKKYSANFLSAHGFERKEGWKTFSTEKSINIFKLIELKKRIGLQAIK